MDGQFGGFVWPRLTPAVKALLIINAAVFALNMVFTGGLGNVLGVSLHGLTDWYGLGVLRVITYQFVHSFDVPFHLIFNMLMLYFFGTFVEEAIGKNRLVRLYLVAGVVGAVVQMVIGASMGSTRGITVGASGSLYGIIVYAACMAPRMRVIFIIFPIELRWLAGGLVGIGVYMMFVELSTGIGGATAHGGHVGGALWGFIAHRIPPQQWAWTGRLRAWKHDRDRRAAGDRQRRLDELLEKINREGLTSLSAAERRFLDRASQEMRRK